MKKLWSYIAVGLAFFSAGLMVAVKWLQVDKVVIQVKKQRIWGRGNTMALDIDPVVDQLKMTRKTKRDNKKLDKLAKKIERKKLRSVRRLEK